MPAGAHELMRIYLLHVLCFLIPVLSFAQSSQEIRFEWRAAESDFRRFEKAEMLIPIRFESDTTIYFLQFDTGATHSYLYSNRFNRFNSGERPMKTSIGDISFRENTTIKATSEANAAVGTLGAGFLKNKVVQINFKNRTIKINMPYNTADYLIRPLNTLNGRPVLRVNLLGKEQDLLYDTGSSLFGIWTNKKNWRRLREKSDSIGTFPISSWGNINTGYYSGIDETLPAIISGFSSKSKMQVWYVDNKNYRKFFGRNKLFGILGNQPFLGGEIVLDYKEKIFGFKSVCDTR